MPECGLKRRDCTREATKRVVIHGLDAEPMTRYTCAAHAGWYRREFTERGYEVDIAPIKALDDF